MSKANPQAGLAGVIAGQTELSTVGKEGHGLTYRGYSIDDLSEYATFEEVAWLLLRGDLPNKSELQGYQAKLQSLRQIPDALAEILSRLPSNSHPMDVLRTGCSALGCIEPETQTDDPFAISDRLLGCFPTMLLTWHYAHQGNTRYEPNTDGGIAESFLRGLNANCSPDAIRAMDVALILYAEHEFNASTFASRITTSTLSDVYAAITSAIGTLRGPLHGGANEAAHELITAYDSPESAHAGILEKLARKEKIMGFGHRVYRECDPRSEIIQRWAKRLADETGNALMYDVSAAIHKCIATEKGLFPNLDFYSATAFHCMGIRADYFTPIFVFSRTAGWCAHILEQRSNNRLIRPGAEYTGRSEQSWLPLDART